MVEHEVGIEEEMVMGMEVVLHIPYVANLPTQCFGHCFDAVDFVFLPPCS